MSYVSGYGWTREEQETEARWVQETVMSAYREGGYRALDRTWRILRAKENGLDARHKCLMRAISNILIFF